MKTTLVIDDGLMRRLRVEAARRRTTISALVEASLRATLARRPAEVDAPPLPAFDGGRAQVDIADRDALYQAMEGPLMLVVDTNVLVYAADMACVEHGVCRGLLEGWRRDVLPWYLTWNVIYEFARVVTHPRVFTKPWTPPAAWDFVQALLQSPSLGLLEHTDRHATVAAQVLAEVPAARGNLVHDLHTAVLMREHGIRRIYTRDADFHRFPFLEVIDPLAP